MEDFEKALNRINAIFHQDLKKNDIEMILEKHKKFTELELELYRFCKKRFLRKQAEKETLRILNLRWRGINA